MSDKFGQVLFGDLADGGQRPDADLERDDQRHVLEVALQRLSPINREAILLKDIQGLALEEIAGMLELPLGTVKSHVARGKARLLELLGDAQ